MQEDCGTSTATIGANTPLVDTSSATWPDNCGQTTWEESAFPQTAKEHGNRPLTLWDLELLEEQEAEAMHQHWQRRERKLWKAKARMPMHGKHLLRDHRKQTRGLR